MGKSGVEKNALNASATAGTQANNAYSTVNPIYSRMATGTVGYSEHQKSDMDTANLQSLGGSVAGATGQGGLYAARTGNAGAATAAINDSARQAGVQESQNALEVDKANADLEQKNMLAGLSGLSGIYDTASRTGVDYLNTAQNASAAKKSMLSSLIDAAGRVGGAYVGR